MADIKDDLKQLAPFAFGLLLLMAATGQGVFEGSALYEENYGAPRQEVREIIEETEEDDPFLNPESPLER